MKLLVDSCVWGGARHVLEGAGYEVLVVADCWSRDPGDEDVLALAYNQGRVLITLDKDFGELAILRGAKHAGIVRPAGIGAREQGLAAHEALEAHGEALRHGAIVTVEPDRVRVRPSE